MANNPQIGWHLEENSALNDVPLEAAKVAMSENTNTPHELLHTKTIKRQRIGYVLTLTALLMLLGGFALAPFISSGLWLQRALGAAITLLPLLLFTPRAIKRDLRAYQALALLAPIYLFFGGVIWLWQSPYWGLWFCTGATLLETGAILHNFQKRKKKNSASTAKR